MRWLQKLSSGLNIHTCCMPAHTWTHMHARTHPDTHTHQYHQGNKSKKRWNGYVAQLVECMISMHKALGSISSMGRNQIKPNQTKPRNKLNVTREIKILMRYHFNFNRMVTVCCLRQAGSCHMALSSLALMWVHQTALELTEALACFCLLNA